MSLFFHPVRLTEAAPREAVREALAYIQRQGMTALHMGTDELCEWWHERDASTITAIERDGARLRLRVSAAGARGCVMQMLVGEELPAVKVNGAPGRFVVRDQHGARWLYVAVPEGDSRVTVRGGGGS